VASTVKRAACAAGWTTATPNPKSQPDGLAALEASAQVRSHAVIAERGGAVQRWRAVLPGLLPSISVSAMRTANLQDEGYPSGYAEVMLPRLWQWGIPRWPAAVRIRLGGTNGPTLV
jgi:hypothetical protein